LAVADKHSEVLEWRVHPARERPLATLSAVAVIAAAGWLTAEAMGSGWWAAFAVGFFLFTLQRYFLPSTYRVDLLGLTVRTLFSSRTVLWTEVRRFHHDERGGFLSACRRPSVFDAFRGIHLNFNGNRRQVVQSINSRLGRVES